MCINFFSFASLAKLSSNFTTAAPLLPPNYVDVKTIQQDMKSNNLSANEAIDMVHDRPLWRLMSTFGTTHSIA